MSRQIGAEFQALPTTALEQRVRVLEQRIMALDDAVTALREQLREASAKEARAQRHRCVSPIRAEDRP